MLPLCTYTVGIHWRLRDKYTVHLQSHRHPLIILYFFCLNAVVKDIIVDLLLVRVTEATTSEQGDYVRAGRRSVETSLTHNTLNDSHLTRIVTTISTVSITIATQR